MALADESTDSALDAERIDQHFVETADTEHSADTQDTVVPVVDATVDVLDVADTNITDSPEPPDSPPPDASTGLPNFLCSPALLGPRIVPVVDAGTALGGSYRCPPMFFSRRDGGLPDGGASDGGLAPAVRPVRPLSGRISTSMLPEIGFVANPDITTVVVEWSRDRYFGMVEQTIEVAASTRTARIERALTPGVWYWRVRARVGMDPPGPPSVAWQLPIVPGAGTVQRSIETLFDLNGDGLAELAMGARRTQNFRGSVRVYYGRCGQLPRGVPDVSYCGALDTNLGHSVVNAGDLDGDGYVEMAVGAPSEGDATSSRGRVYVFWGGPDGISLDRATELGNPAAQRLFGGRLAGLGDVNGDGYGDFAVAAGNFSSFPRRHIEVFLGTPDRSLRRVVAVTGLMGMGYVAPAGDLDGDGRDELVVAGAVDQSLTVYSWSTSTDRFAMVAATTISTTPSTNIWPNFVGAGDRDGDGRYELAVGDQGFNAEQGQIRFYRLGMGSPASLEALETFAMADGRVGDNFPLELRIAGDVNLDGFQDLIAGAPYTFGSGRAYILLGSMTGFRPTSQILMRRPGGFSGGGFGFGSNGIGDMDGNGYPEVALGAYTADPSVGTDAGIVALYPGGATGPVLSPTIFEGTPGEYFGYSIALRSPTRQRDFSRAVPILMEPSGKYFTGNFL